jgi:hypothetical protein
MSAVTTVETERSLRETLSALEALLEREQRALVALDRGAIDDAANEKTKLEAQLRALMDSGVALRGDEARVSAERVRLLAQKNQVLLVHARACLRGVLALATGQAAGPSYTPPAANARGPSRAAAIRVDTKG